MSHVIRLTYIGKLPRINKQAPSYWYRWNLKKACLKQFGELPPSHRQTLKGHLKITRVLGKHEREMDAFENLPVALKGLVDSLVEGGYLVNDKPRWMSHEPIYQDSTRRWDGPKIEVEIRYHDREEEA